MPSVSATPESAQRFLNRLANDDDYRARLERDPATALLEEGIMISDLPKTIVLPPKEIFASALDSAKAQGVGGVQPQSPFYAFLAFFAFMV